MTNGGVVPREFEELLTREGRRILAGASDVCGALADPRRRFLVLENAISKSGAQRLRQALETSLLPHLEDMAMPIPPETIWQMKRDYDEWLPKTARVRTAYLERRRSASYRVANEIGLVDLLASESLALFAERIAGRKLDRRGGQQVLCYGPGDYAGPHNDHHPENSRAAAGYLDLHLSLATRSVEHQYLVYAKGGHFTEMLPVHGLGTLTVYRLPFWHYTTPLQAKPGQEARARRWVLLATWLYAGERKKKQNGMAQASGQR